jgi:acetylornithine deacetylase/succinyl-diaminopimelate desuccinylase-like protein
MRRLFAPYLASMVVGLATILGPGAVSTSTGQSAVSAPQSAAPLQIDPERLVALQALAGDERVARALELLRDREDEILALQIRFTEIPAPDPRAVKRAALLAQQLRKAGLQRVRQDAAGNVLAVLPGAQAGAGVVILSAHLDTVFPELDSIRVVREGAVLRAPGIGDDAAGLAAIVHLARALREARVPLRRDLVVVGTVGEEGEGDLRGVKALFDHEIAPPQVAAFLTLDAGSQSQIVNEGLGSRRLHVIVRGPGGHSWGDFGRPNPIHALARAIDAFLDMPLQPGVRSSFNVGVIEGGSGVNVIPESASLRIDLRSESPPALADLESRFRAAVQGGVEREKEWAQADVELQFEIEVIGDRPVGRTDPATPLVATVAAAFASQSLVPALASSSTDANLPMSRAVPALALPHGCRGFDTHSRNEWCDTTGRPAVLAANLLTLVAVGELHGPLRPRRATTD